MALGLGRGMRRAAAADRSRGFLLGPYQVENGVAERAARRPETADKNREHSTPIGAVAILSQFSRCDANLTCEKFQTRRTQLKKLFLW